MPALLFQSAEDVVREIARLQRNYEFLSYGLMAAWIILVVYVLMMVGRQKRSTMREATMPMTPGCQPSAPRTTPRQLS